MKRKLLVVSLSFGFCIWLLWLFFLTPICPNSVKAHRYNHLLKPLKMQVKDDEKSPKTILETVELRVKKVEEFCKSRNNKACQKAI